VNNQIHQSISENIVPILVVLKSSLKSFTLQARGQSIKTGKNRQ